METQGTVAEPSSLLFKGAELNKLAGTFSYVFTDHVSSHCSPTSVRCLKDGVHLMSSQITLCFPVFVQCVALGLIDSTLCKSCSGDRIIDFLIVLFIFFITVVSECSSLQNPSASQTLIYLYNAPGRKGLFLALSMYRGDGSGHRLKSEAFSNLEILIRSTWDQ